VPPPARAGDADSEQSNAAAVKGIKAEPVNRQNILLIRLPPKMTECVATTAARPVLAIFSGLSLGNNWESELRA